MNDRYENEAKQIEKMDDQQKRYAQVQAGLRNQRRRGLSFDSLTHEEKLFGLRLINK